MRTPLPGLLILLTLSLPALPVRAQDDDPLAPPRGADPEPTPAPPPPRAKPRATEGSSSSGSARKPEKRDAARDRFLNLPNRIGLTGFGDLIDARVPQRTVALRGGLRYRLQLSDREVRFGEQDSERHEFPLYAGVSLLSHFEAGLRATYAIRTIETHVNAGPNPIGTDRESGWADLELGGKASLDFLGMISVGAYGHGRIPVDTDVTRLASLDLGLTGTFALWDDRIGLHGNVGGVFVEEGGQALRYRVGASLVPLAWDLLTLRTYAYLDGLEYEGSADSDLDLELGAQGILFGFLTVEVGFGVRLLDGGHVDRDLQKALQASGLFDRSIDDDGTWEFELGAGVQLSF